MVFLDMVSLLPYTDSSNNILHLIIFFYEEWFTVIISLALEKIRDCNYCFINWKSIIKITNKFYNCLSL